MNTQIWQVNTDSINSHESQQKLKTAGDALRSGHVIAFPTETVYGLGANACDESAATKIFQAKGRPSDNPLIVHLADASEITNVIPAQFISPLVQQLINKFWPGPLSIVFPYDETLAREHGMKHIIASSVRANNRSVAIRVPSDPIAQQLIHAAGCPIAAPSANRSGRPSPTTAGHVEQDLSGLIWGIVDGGHVCHVGVESTVIKLVPIPGDGEEDSYGVRILRPGFVTAEALAEFVDSELISYCEDDAKNAVDPCTSSASSSNNGFQPECPGTKYRHYAPEKPLYLCANDRVLKDAVKVSTEQLTGRIGILITEENPDRKDYESNDRIDVCLVGSRQDLPSVARNLFGCLRTLDGSDSLILLSEQFDDSAYSHDELHLTIMNRLSKAAGHAFFSSASEFADTALKNMSSTSAPVKKSLKRSRSEESDGELPPPKKVRLDECG